MKHNSRENCDIKHGIPLLHFTLSSKNWEQFFPVLLFRSLSFRSLSLFPISDFRSLIYFYIFIFQEGDNWQKTPCEVCSCIAAEWICIQNQCNNNLSCPSVSIVFLNDETKNIAGGIDFSSFTIWNNCY